MYLAKITWVLLTVAACASALSEELLRTTKTWEGGDIIYPEGNAEITSVRVSIAAGETTPFHCHPVPTLGYVLSGSVEVETKSGKKQLFSAGESVVEVLRTVHRGRAVDGPVEILVFYAGAEAIPNTVLQAEDSESLFCRDG